jgi:hypothetical protein
MDVCGDKEIGGQNDGGTREDTRVNLSLTRLSFTNGESATPYQGEAINPPQLTFGYKLG